MILAASVLWTIAIVVAALTSPMSGLSRFLSPQFTVTAILATIFGYRPMADDRFSLRNLYGYTPSISGQEMALVAGMLFVTCLCFGLILRHASIERGHVKPSSERTRDDAEGRDLGGAYKASSPRISVALLSVPLLSMLGLAGYAAAVAVFAGPTFLTDSFRGRSALTKAAAVPEIFSLLPLLGSLAAAYYLVSVGKRRISRAEIVCVAGAVTISLATVSLLGNRRYMIPCLLAPLIARVVGRRTKLRWLHGVVSIFGFMLLAVIPFVRSEGARDVGQSLPSAIVQYLRERGVGDTAYSFIASYDTEMFDYVALRAASLASGETLGWGRGLILELVARPLPNGLDPFGVPYSDQLLSEYFGSACADGVCPVPSVVGVLFFDGGLPLVAIGGFISGLLLHYLGEIVANQSSARPLHGTVMVVLAANAIVAARTQTVHAAWWSAYMIIFVVLIHRFMQSAVQRDGSLVRDREQGPIPRRHPAPRP